MARTKGVSRRNVLFKHALRPSLFSFITVFGITTGALIGGSLIVEKIFRVPGLGSCDRRSHPPRGLPGRARDRDDHPVRVRRREHPRRPAVFAHRSRGCGDERRRHDRSRARARRPGRERSCRTSQPSMRTQGRSDARGRLLDRLGWLVLVIGWRSWRRGCRSRTRTPTTSSPANGRRTRRRRRTGSAPTRTHATCSRRTIYGARVSLIVGFVGHRVRHAHRRHARHARRVLPRHDRPGHLVRLPRAAVVPGAGARDPDHGAARPQPASRSRSRSASSRIAPVGRLARATTISFAEREFVIAARTLGAKTSAHHRPRAAAQRGDPDGSARAARHGRRDRRRGRPRLPRSVGREGADLGQAHPHRRRGAPRPRECPVDLDLPDLVLFLTVLALNFAGDRSAQLLRRAGDRL